MPGCELIPTTALRTGARDEHLTRYPSAYCHRQPHAGAPRSLVEPKVSDGMHLPTSRPEISMPVRQHARFTERLATFASGTSIHTPSDPSPNRRFIDAVSKD